MSSDHSTVPITMDLYSHLVDGMDTIAAAKIDEAFCKGKSGSGD